MDAKSLKAAPSSGFHVKSADGEPLYDGESEVRINMHGPGSRAAGTVKSRQTARTLKRINENDGKLTAPTAEEALKEQAEDLATLTISFEHLSHGDLAGTALFEAVYGDPELGYITAQADRHFKDWGKFKPGSAGN